MKSEQGMFRILAGKNERDEHVLAVIVKRSYRLAPDNVLVRREQDLPLRAIDSYYDDGDPERSTVQHESELAPYKPSADVVVIGRAYAPNDAPTQAMTVALRVGAREKVLSVVGDRRCCHRPGADPTFTDPQPFRDMEIRYERAYGGRDEQSVAEIPFHYPRNPLGRGVALRNARAVIDSLALPNIEDPHDLLTPERVVIGEPERWHLQPLPQGFGWYQRTWYPRCALLGAYPAFLAPAAVTAEERMGLLPRNHIALAKQFRLPVYEAFFNNGASLGMTFKGLAGNEPLCLRGLTPEGILEFSLPGETPQIVLDIGRGETPLESRLHTVSIRPDERAVDLIWRGAQVFEGYGWYPKMKRLHARVLPP